MRVWTTCPRSGKAVCTAAEMTAREFERFDGNLVLWCPTCRCAHSAARADLWQQPDRPWSDSEVSGWRRLWQGGHPGP